MRFVDRVCSLDFMSSLLFSLPDLVCSREKLDTRLCGIILEFKKLYVFTFDIFVAYSAHCIYAIHKFFVQETSNLQLPR